MKIINIKLISAIVVIAILAGCAVKKDNVVYKDTQIIKKNNEQKKDVINNIDSKLSNIKTTNSNIDNNKISSIKKDTYMNQITSIIEGKSVTLTSIHFDFDNYIIKDEILPIVQENSVKISSIVDYNSNVKVKLEGNCDEWGTDEYNFALGLKRTKTVRDALIANGIHSSNIIVVSLGESNPICKDKIDSCWKQNRRVDHLLLP
jgi:peptidoglycan-associated lipoprotein